MSDRSPESDWEQPRGDFSRGGGPHYSGDPYGNPMTTPLAASSWQRNHGWIIGLVVGGVLLGGAIAVFFVLAT